ncbi:DsrE family protein [Sinomonas sp. B1-1]|uniref:DsrE family protein n=1 Tax=Sinomonas sp. B1-1 TaxID=3141454 RepID=UPI003D2DA894
MTDVPRTMAGLCVHGNGPSPETWLPASMRTALNAVADLGGDRPVELVVQGPGVALLTAGKGAEGPAAQLDELLGAGIAVLACANSLRSAGVDESDLRPGVRVVPAAVGHLARRQWDGWAYVRV